MMKKDNFSHELKAEVKKNFENLHAAWSQVRRENSVATTEIHPHKATT